MKKYILVFFIFFVCGYVKAQEEGVNTDLSFGAKGGLNISDFLNTDKAESLVGFHAGFFGEFNFRNKFSLQPELLLSVQGAKFKDGDVKLAYFSLPLIVKYYFSTSLYVETGPQLSFLLSAKKAGMDVRDSFKNTDVGLDLGAGYIVANDFSIGLRYGLGLLRLQDSLEADETAIKNSVFKIALGYVFY